MGPEDALVIVSKAQWPEARSFERVYTDNPERQSRFVQAMCGYRATLTRPGWEHKPDAAETVEAIDVVIRSFVHNFPECLEENYVPSSEAAMGETYHLDDRLRPILRDVIEVDLNG